MRRNFGSGESGVKGEGSGVGAGEEVGGGDGEVAVAGKWWAKKLEKCCKAYNNLGGCALFL